MDTAALSSVALSVRSLTMDAVQAANSGHPGLPMGLAELGAVLYGEILKHNPRDPQWPDRDRLVLSAGHGCMLLYSMLYLSGYDVPLSEIKRFRQLGSRAAGHPEYGALPGIETTTGPLGQGLGNAVGMAIAERILALRFNTADHTVVDHYTYAIAGDGCMMEGVTSEASSLAGHLGLGKLIVFYDSNGITIEGSTGLAFTEDTAARYKAYGWHVQQADAYDMPGMAAMVERAKKETGRPSLIIVTSVIGKGSPNKAGTHSAHGAALGKEEVALTKKALGIPEDAQFYVDDAGKKYLDGKLAQRARQQDAWEDTFRAWAKANPDRHEDWKRWHEGVSIQWNEMPEFEVGSAVATRNAGGKVLATIAVKMPNLIGGSADLDSSNKSNVPGAGEFQKGSYDGRNMHFGVREHGMGAIVNGMALHGGIRPYAATFLVFADYMRPPIRLASLMKLPVIYVFTHDSIYVGEDGPTHQPIEQLASLRIIPNLHVLRPADAAETALAWKMALDRKDGPTALALTRQNLPVLEKPRDWRGDAEKGAYVLRDGGSAPNVVLVATGSEVELAVRAAAELGPSTRVVSMISREIFAGQDSKFREKILPSGAKRLVIEVGVRSGWEGIAGDTGSILSIERFGESGPGEEVGRHFGFTVENVVARARAL